MHSTSWNTGYRECLGSTFQTAKFTLYKDKNMIRSEIFGPFSSSVKSHPFENVPDVYLDGGALLWDFFPNIFSDRTEMFNCFLNAYLAQNQQCNLPSKCTFEYK